jgi:ribosomal protein S18 acetylase RimI-like enzyme
MTAIRPARIDELDGLLDIVRAATRHMESQGLHQWDDIYPDRATLQQDVTKQHMQVIEVNGQVAGMVSINDEQSHEYRNVLWQYSGKALVVHRLTIDPEHQRKKLASQLMDFAEREAADKKYESIRLDAFEQNSAAIAFYKRRGYRKAGTVLFRKGPFICYEKRIHNHPVECKETRP